MITRISLSRFRLRAATLALWLGAGACSGDNLPDPLYPNVVDTAVIYAINGTAIGTASGFDILSGLPVRLELGDLYDLAFDIDSTGSATLYPGSLLGLPSSAGMQQTTAAFDDIPRAPLDDYVTDTALVVEDGMVFIARSRTSSESCHIYVGSVPRYGKFEVIGIDETARTVTLKHLINLNCGYRDLTPGLPVR